MAAATEAWIELARSMGQRAFVAQHPGWFLLISREPGELATIEDTLSNVKRAALARRMLEVRWIEGNAREPRRFTVGRSSKCDVPFGHPSVSKQHAYLDVDGKLLAVTDDGSRNGTKVNGEEIAAGRPAPVQLRDRVQFGSVQAMVLDARELFETLSRLG
jgi:hypothetical protein